MVQALAGISSFEENIYKQFYFGFGNPNADELGLNAKILFPYFDSSPSFNGDIWLKSHALEAIAIKKVKLLESGDCPRASDEANADASVTEHNFNGEVCFSVGNLTKVAPSDLTRQVMALMLHEAVHLGGGDETQARRFQEAFTVYFGSRFGEMVGEAYVTEIDGKFNQILADLMNPERFFGKSFVIFPVIYARYGAAFGALRNLHGIDDPVALRLRLFLTNANVVEDFSRALEILLKSIDDKFRVEASPRVKTVMNLNEMTAVTSDIKQKAEALSMAWRNMKWEALCTQTDSIHKMQSWEVRAFCEESSRLK